MKAQKFIFLLPVLLIFSCGEKNGPGRDEHQPPVNSEQAGRIRANLETTEGIRNMKTLVDQLPDQPSKADYDALKVGLQQEFTGILKKCTMEGAAHDSLHKFLIPVEANINAIDGENMDGSAEATERLGSHLEKYSLHFE